MRAVASIGENRSKLYATVIVHYFYRLFLFPPLLPSRFSRYTYICFGLPPSLPFFPFFFSFHVTRMFAKKRKEKRDIPILNSDINIMENRKKKGGNEKFGEKGMPIFERLTVVRTSSSCIKYEKTRVTMLPFRSILFAYTCFRVYHNAAYIL